MSSLPVEIPAHVPRERVVDVDLYAMPGAERDFLAPWKALQDQATGSLVWTPHNGGHWIVTRGRDIARIYADHENFSSRITIVPRVWGERYPLKPTTLDPPEHRPYRRLINLALSRARIEAAAPKIRDLAAAAVERVYARGHCEVIHEFATPIPTALFLHLAEIPEAEAAKLPGYGEDPRNADGSIPERGVMDRFADFLRPHVAERRRRPGSDLLSAIATSTLDGWQPSEDEAVEVATAVLTGGLDTVVSSLALMLAFLAEHPAHRRRLVGDPAATRAAVVELLRRFPIMTKARLVVRDQEIEGVTLKAGDMVVMPPLHGLDDREFDDPLTVDFDRPRAAHSTFGNGVHRCPGAVLTEIELEIVLQEWLRRIPEFEVDPERPIRMRGGVLGAVVALHLQWPF